MTGKPPDSALQTLKCSECGAKITPDAIQLGNPIICEYCGAINVQPTHPTRLQASSRGARHPWMRAQRRALRAPLLHTIRLLTEKGAIDAKTLQQYTKRNIDKRVRPIDALRQALRQMRDDGKLDKDKILRTVDELITENKLPPRVQENVTRLFQ
jgi:hypothetical protein